MSNNVLSQEKFIALLPYTRFRYIHDVNGDVVQGNNKLDMSMNEKGYGIFLTVNGFPSIGEATEQRLKSLNANYVDIDFDKKLPESEKERLLQEKIMSCLDTGIPSPTIINRTKNGAHLFWLFLPHISPTPENIVMWKDVQKRLVQIFDGDKHAVDTSRVLRVPYTKHLKNPDEPFEIKTISYKSQCVYTLADLDALLPQYTQAELSSEKVSAKEILKEGVKVGVGLRHMAIAQIAGLTLKEARTPEQIQMARLALYGWDRCVVNSPEPFASRRKELDNTFENILEKELSGRSAVTNGKSKAIIQCFTSIKPEPISWLWPERIALGKLTLIAGDPGLGKSLISVTISAALSKGYNWPVGGTSAPVGDVVFISAEDDPADTVRPRLDAAEADCRRIHILKAIQSEEVGLNAEPKQRMFSLKNDMLALEEVLMTLPNCKLVIVDPISAYMDGIESHANADVRGLLAPLAELAARHKVAVLAISHLNKNSNGNAMYRTMGSLAFVAAARAAFLVTKDRNTPGRVLILPIKNNIAKTKTGMAYSVIEASNGAPVMVWEPKPVEMTADEALSVGEESNEEKGDTDWAVDFLQDILGKGPVSATDILKESKKLKIGEKALRRAQKKLGIKTHKLSFKGAWVWSMPIVEVVQDDQDAVSNTEGILDHVGNLGSQSGISDHDFFDVDSKS
jgi:putative DNA primase/helicase